MSVPGTYYLNGPTLETATSVFTDADLTTCAPDGFYSDGVIRYVNNANALSGVSFFYSSGNIDGGVFKLYGIK
jgi:hypothetical protein